MNDTSTKIKKAGDLGEETVKYISEKLGYLVEMSLDKYDMIKDMFIDQRMGLGPEKVEVKKQAIFVYFKGEGDNFYYKAFTVPITDVYGNHKYNQLPKCLNADRFLVVEEPKPYDNVVKVWEAPPKGQRKYKYMKLKDGRIVAGFPLKDFTLYGETSNEYLLNGLKKTSTSEWYRKRYS